ncbi:MAG: NAD(P)-dependent alcohol dehydrogenase [Spirochaetaceae bacterium]|nr:NAD(P)-dependent alcohol dehydrogenase [Spirochaetaceae bacterium]
MKAVVYEKYGSPDVLEYKDIEKPAIGENEVLIKVFGSSVNFHVPAFMEGKPLLARLWSGFFRPKENIPGSDIAGQVEAVGSKVKNFSPGDEVFGNIGCFGAFAEYSVVSEDALVVKPGNVSFIEAAAAAEAAVVALQGLRDKGQIQKGKKVLICGASGGIGTFAVQIAKSFGAEVTGLCSTGNMEMVRSLGADYVIDYLKEDFTRNGQKYDLILATAGYHSIFDYRRSLSRQGIYVSTGGALAQTFQAMLLGPIISMFGRKKMGNITGSINRNDLLCISQLLESGRVRSHLDRCYPLKEAAEALRYYGKGHARGKVGISVHS